MHNELGPKKGTNLNLSPVPTPTKGFYPWVRTISPLIGPILVLVPTPKKGVLPLGWDSRKAQSLGWENQSQHPSTNDQPHGTPIATSWLNAKGAQQPPLGITSRVAQQPPLGLYMEELLLIFIILNLGVLLSPLIILKAL